MSEYFCCDDNRRAAVKAHGTLNGLDYLEVAPDQYHLYIYFLKPLAPNDLVRENFQIDGGDRFPNIRVVEIGNISSNRITLTVEQPGDFSIYTLRLVADKLDPARINRFDRLLREIDFSFKVNCPSEFDCRSEHLCPPEPEPLLNIDYLAKDYASFRQLMLDRLAVLLPQGLERHPADLGTTLVELLAYVADRLSYQQDAIANEAYLATARHRISVRRHARLVDYPMHEGCNARVWVQITAKEDKVPIPVGTAILSQLDNRPPVLNPSELNRLLPENPLVFETIEDTTVFLAHQQFTFYTWGAGECCLPKGATRATLAGHYPNLQVGNVLIFAELRSPISGLAEEADATRRHAVRLTAVTLSEDPLGGRFPDPALGNDDPVPITEITWHSGDALPFPLCISGVIEGDRLESNLSAAWGNIVLADHGLTIIDEDLGTVTAPSRFRIPANNSSDFCQKTSLTPIYPRFNPSLQQKPLTHRLISTAQASATATLQGIPEKAIAAITLTSNRENQPQSWQARPDLINSRPSDPHFAIEVETDGTAFVRFGNDEQGLRPLPDSQFSATYRVGNGSVGNIGAGSLAHILTTDNRILRVINPLPARGGTDPESIAVVKQNAPVAFRTQERAVTPDDYAAIANRHPQVQKATASFRWTGSWHTVFISVDPLGGIPIERDRNFQQELQQLLANYRLAGHDLEIDSPRYVSLELELLVCVKSDYFRSNVKSALLQVFSNRLLGDGRRGVFHPDNFTFGQPVYLSPLYQAALSVAGVDSIQITTFQRQGTPSSIAIEKGFITLGRLEIARLDNDPDFPERGILRLNMKGGK